MDFLSRLEKMPENERKDWSELEDESGYLVVHHFYSGTYNGLNYEEKQKAYVQKNGENANALVTLDVYGHSLRLNDSVFMALQNRPVREAAFEWSSIDLTPNNKWLHVPVYQFYRADDNSSNKEEIDSYEQAEVCLIEEHDK